MDFNWSEDVCNFGLLRYLFVERASDPFRNPMGLTPYSTPFSVSTHPIWIPGLDTEIQKRRTFDSSLKALTHATEAAVDTLLVGTEIKACPVSSPFTGTQVRCQSYLPSPNIRGGGWECNLLLLILLLSEFIRFCPMVLSMHQNL